MARTTMLRVQVDEEIKAKPRHWQPWGCLCGMLRVVNDQTFPLKLNKSIFLHLTGW